MFIRCPLPSFPLLYNEGALAVVHSVLRRDRDLIYDYLALSERRNPASQSRQTLHSRLARSTRYTLDDSTLHDGRQHA